MTSTLARPIKGFAIDTAREETRVAWVFPSLARGFYWQPVFKAFAARFPRTVIFTGIWPGYALGYENAFEVQILRGVRFIDLKEKVGDAHKGFIRTPLSILKKLAVFRPHVVFSSGFSGWTVCALLLKLIRRSRVIIFWEGCSTNAVGTSKLRHFTRRQIARLADAAVSNADEGIEDRHDILGMPKNKLLCHPCEVPDLALLCSGEKEAFPANARRPVFLYVASLSPRKGWRYLMDAAALLTNQGHKQFSIVFVGAGEQESELHTAIKLQGLEGFVHPIGPVPYHNLGSYYRNADVFVSPTREDTWGVAVLEGMAFGKPVLCSKFAGSSQMVKHGENGFIFDPFHTEELASYMGRFILDPELVEQMGAKSLKQMQPFTPVSAASALADLALQTP